METEFGVEALFTAATANNFSAFALVLNNRVVSMNSNGQRQFNWFWKSSFEKVSETIKSECWKKVSRDSSEFSLGGNFSDKKWQKELEKTKKIISRCFMFYGIEEISLEGDSWHLICKLEETNKINKVFPLKLVGKEILSVCSKFFGSMRWFKVCWVKFFEVYEKSQQVSLKKRLKFL